MSTEWANSIEIKLARGQLIRGVAHQSAHEFHRCHSFDEREYGIALCIEPFRGEGEGDVRIYPWQNIEWVKYTKVPITVRDQV